jgi:hypothetical protein
VGGRAKVEKGRGREKGEEENGQKNSSDADY